MTKVNPPAALILPKISFPTLGWTVIDWTEEFLVHGRGDVQGQGIKLDLEERLGCGRRRGAGWRPA